MDLLKNIVGKILNEATDYLQYFKEKTNFDKKCLSFKDAYNFINTLAHKIGDDVNSYTTTKYGRKTDSVYGESRNRQFTWKYRIDEKYLSVHFKNSTGSVWLSDKPVPRNYVYPKHEFTDFVSKIYTNERTGEIDVDYTTKKTEAYAILNTPETIQRFRDYMDRTGHAGHNMYFEDYTNSPKKKYKI